MQSSTGQTTRTSCWDIFSFGNTEDQNIGINFLLSPSCDQSLIHNVPEHQLQEPNSYSATALVLDSNEIGAALQSDEFANINNMYPVPTKLIDEAMGNGGDDVADTCEDLNIPGDLYLNPESPYDSVVWSPSFEIDLDVDRLYDILPSKKEDPTLAELNSRDKSLLDELDLESLPLPEETSSSIRTQGGVCTVVSESQGNTPCAFVCDIPTSKSSSPIPTFTVAPQPLQAQDTISSSAPQHSTLHELLMHHKSAKSVHVSRPTVFSKGKHLEKLIIKKLPEEAKVPTSHNDYKIELADQSEEKPRRTSISNSFTIHEIKEEPLPHSEPAIGDNMSSSGGDADSHDEGFDSDPEDSAASYSDSDDSDDNFDDVRILNSDSKPRKKDRYFWQYNLQAKGPKGRRLPLQTNYHDPHQLGEASDPVFSPVCQVQGIKHSGKARRGDGNDLTPNPNKLNSIGLELKKLNKIINDLIPVSELPFNSRPKSRKEKNKLASRACRLKKKAQHEANKIKLYGLEHEHGRLLYVLSEARKLFLERVKDSNDNNDRECIAKVIEALTRTYCKTKVAGQSADFVNSILDDVCSGNAAHILDL